MKKWPPPLFAAEHVNVSERGQVPTNVDARLLWGVATFPITWSLTRMSNSNHKRFVIPDLVDYDVRETINRGTSKDPR